MFKVFTGAAVGPQDTEQHRWNTLRQVFLHNIPFQRMRRLKWMLRARRQRANAWPLAVSPSRVTFTPLEPAESWKAQGSLPHADYFFLRTQQVITEQGKRCLGTMQCKEVLKFHHGVFASFRDKIKQDWIEGTQAGLLIHLATGGQSFPCRIYVCNVQTGRIQFLKERKIFMEIHVFNAGNLQDLDGSIIFLFFLVGTCSTRSYM